MKYAYMLDNSTPTKVVRRIALSNKVQEFKFQKMRNAQLIEKDSYDGKLKQRGAKWTEVTKEHWVNSVIEGLHHAQEQYSELGLDFNLEKEVKRLSKKLSITPKQIKEKLKEVDNDYIEAEFTEK